RSRVVAGARGRPARVYRVATHGPTGRCLAGLGLARAPYVWSVLRGNLHWVGTTPRTLTHAATLVERGEEGGTSRPGLVTLAHAVPFRLRWHDRLALDRLYAGTRTITKDLWLLGSVLGRRVRQLWRGLRGSRSSSYRPPTRPYRHPTT